MAPCTLLVLSALLLIGFSHQKKSSTSNDDSFKLSEADQMALEESVELLPPLELAKNIKKHLEVIRQTYPIVSKISHRRKWSPGQLIIMTVKEAQISALNSSQYGPLKGVHRFGKISSVLITFAKPYNPQILAEHLKMEFGIDDAQPNEDIGDGNDVQLIASEMAQKNSETSTDVQEYLFKKGWGDCLSGCIYKHLWEFWVTSVGANVTAELEKEYGDKLPKDSGKAV